MSTPVRDRRLVSRRVFDDELVVIASRHHRFAQQARVRLAQMRDETLFIYPPKEESGPLQNVLLPAGAVPARVEEVQLTEAITELVKAGLGVAILARWAVQPLIDAGSIVGALAAGPRHAPGLERGDAEGSRGADYVNEFIDLLAKHAPTSRRGAPAAIATSCRCRWPGPAEFDEVGIRSRIRREFQIPNSELPIPARRPRRRPTRGDRCRLRACLPWRRR